VEGENHTGLYLVGIIALLFLIPAAVFGAIAPIGILPIFYGECKVLGLCHGVGEEGAGGEICTQVPEPYRTIFAEAGDKWKVQPAFIAAIFYAGEHGSSWPPYEEHAPLGSHLNPQPHDCNSGVGCIRGPMQIGEKNWPSWSNGAYGTNLPLDRIEWTKDAIYVATYHLAMIGAGGNTTDENKLTEAAAKYNGGTNPSNFSYEVYAKNVLTAFRKFHCPALAGSCSESIIEQAKKYAGIPYSQDEHCGPPTLGPAGVTALDCSGFVSRVYRDLGLFPESTCLTTKTVPGFSYLKEVSANEIKTGDLVLSCCPGHVVLYVSGDVTNKFTVWESGGGEAGGDVVREALRTARPNQRYFRATKCQ
jgi:cell wall-associated NlpC family hydrolase